MKMHNPLRLELGHREGLGDLVDGDDGERDADRDPDHEIHKPL